jgi:predicted glycoside hydrolase/deacetylase ChbG (UPF0249 family)
VGRGGAVEVIVNGDDFGYTAGVSAGILLAAERGVLTSTTAMMTTASVARAVEVARRDLPRLPIGVHLVLTYGRPLSPPSEVPSLVDATGALHRVDALRREPTRVAPVEVEREWRRQIDRLIGLGVAPDHLDSHHHVSYLHPDLTEVMLRLAGEYHLPVRRPPASESHPDVPDVVARSGVWTPDVFVGDLFHEASPQRFAAAVARLPAGVVAEVMAHPGVVDDELCAVSSYARPRAGELATLLDPRTRRSLADHGARLTTFGAAAARAQAER